MGEDARAIGGLWVPLLVRGGGPVLWIGSARSGALPLLERCAGPLVVLDPPRTLPLAFEDERFGLVVHEGAAPRPELARELARVARSRVVLLGDEGVLRLGAAELAAAGLAHERALRLSPDLAAPAWVAGAAGALPHPPGRSPGLRALLGAGARRLGLRRARPCASALLARKGAHALEPALLEHALDELALQLGEPRPGAEHVLASCGDTLEVFTACAGAREDEPPGRWRLHLALRPDHGPALLHGHRVQARLLARAPAVPLAEPLAELELAGLPLVCERRLAGWTADHMLRDARGAGRLALALAEPLAALAPAPRAPLTPEELDRRLDRRAQLALERGAEARGSRAFGRQLERAREALRAVRPPDVAQHGDLRPKHVVVDRAGCVLGLVHWGVADEQGLAGIDLVHFLVSARVGFTGMSEGEAWRALCDPARWSASERAALERYAAALGLAPDALGALAEAYPLCLGAVAYAHSAAGPRGWLVERFDL